MNPTHDRIQNEIQKNKIVLYMKGTPKAPMCGFSAIAVQCLDALGAKYHAINVLEDIEIRRGIKDFSNWPTIPQLYIKGQFIGGSDITKELFENGELKKLIEA